jgi:NAD(P)-dependent dehydrogenase (short-subunit alcohol dehydrogenase family)
MNKTTFNDLKDKTCVITGGAGVIGTAIAKGLGAAGVQTVIMDLNNEAAERVALEVTDETGTRSVGVEGNVLKKDSLINAKEYILKEFNSIDFLINGAGGNSPKATTQIEEINKDDLGDLGKTFFGLEIEAFQKVFDLNFIGTLLPSMVFAEDMVKAQKGAILNISSMNSYRPLTKIPAYSAAKASVNNFTQWLAVHFAKSGIRVNAIAPGFFLTNQNRFLLLDEKTEELTPRGEKIIANTPMDRFGDPEDLQGTVLYLLSNVSAFVTGVIIPVDGGFNAFSGV